MKAIAVFALLGLVCAASASRVMLAAGPGPAPAPAPGPGMGMTLAPTIAPAGESAPSAQLPCPCALPEGSYDVTATNLAELIRSSANCPLDMTAGTSCPSGNYGYNNTGGCGNVGCNNQGTGNVGSNNSGSNNRGDNNNGSNNVGYCLDGSDLSGNSC